MKQQIESALSILLGLPLSDSWRPNVTGFQTMQRFEFGVQRPTTDKMGQRLTVGDYALDVWCAWRLVGQGRILTAYSDLFYSADNPTESGGAEDFDCYAPGASRRDKHIRLFTQRLADAPLLIESIDADEVGSVRFTLSQNYRLELLPMDSLPYEFWRLFSLHAQSGYAMHAVVTGEGFSKD